MSTQHLDNKIYKVKYLIDNKINAIYIFYGKKEKGFSEETTIQNLFSNKEIEEINTNKAIIVFSEQKIHQDDSIATIKIKILNEMKKTISLEEIYLFCKKLETLHAVSIYQSLTQNKKLSLTKLRINQFILNINSDKDGNKIKPLENKDTYTYDDIFSMKLDDKQYILDKVLGQKFFIVENEYAFVCNPYNVEEYDKFLEKNSRKSLSTLNNHLLLNTGDIIDDSIYVCLAENVLSYAENKDLSSETTLKIYYPFLYNKNINSLEDLERNRNKLIQENKKYNNDKIKETFKTIDMFYDVYEFKKTSLNYLNKGIKFIKAVIKPDFSVKIPIEIIFKVIHATENNPLIKYNPSSKQENVYRLYVDKISTDGRKIPYLKKSTIFKLIKTIGRSKSVSVYIETNELQLLVCEFDDEGYITIMAEFNEPSEISFVNEMLRKMINPIIDDTKVVLEQSGYKFNNFYGLDNENIEIKQMTYESQITITKKFDIQQYKTCLSSIFIDETDKLKTNKISLRFKRVSNYSKFTSQEAFVLEKSEQGLRGDEIIQALLDNFPEDLNREQAVELVRKIANELEVERGVRKTDIKIKDNPGFKTEMTIDFETATLKITTENINNINYLSTIPIYIDTIVRLTQDINSTNFSVEEINKLCKNKNIVDVSIPDIVSSTEESVTEGEDAIIEPDETIQYTKYTELKEDEEKVKPKGALSLFFDDDDEDFDNSNSSSLEGGKTSSSEESITSDNLSSFNESNINVPIEKKSASPLHVDIPSSSSETSISSIKSIKHDDDNNADDKSLSSLETISKKEGIKDAKPLSSKSSIETKPSSTSKSVNVKGLEEAEEKVEEEQEEKQVEKEQAEEEKVEEEEVKEEQAIKNIDGIKLNKPYYFQSLIEKKDPILIMKEDTPEYNSYSRTCLSDKRRQPVILTDSQLDKINKEHPNFLREQDVIKYGSDKKHQFNYICPRYWCLKNNTIIDPKDLKQVKGKDGKIELVHPTCGKVLPKKEKSVKPGYYIYEFYGEGDEAYPGLIPDKHPDGLCLPCCFKNYNTEGRIKAKTKCLEKNKDTEQDKKVKKQDKKKIDDKAEEEKIENMAKTKEKEFEKEEEYVLGPDKFPLEPKRWGYLPPEIQTILHEINADCQISKTNTNLKENHPCLLRHGVEVNKKQSFVACISDAIFFGKKIIDDEQKQTTKIAKVLSLKEMRERIIKAINIDTFIKYQNGNLVLNFHDPNRNVDVNKYSNTKLYSKLDMNIPENKAYYIKVVSAFENFKDFLSDDDALIDHTYLWDIVSMPNKYLFPNGVNLIIFQLPHDDITNNVQLLCPTNHYSNEFYQARKPTIILIKEDGYYEPVYSYLKDGNKIIVAKEFKEYDPQLSKTMRAVFKEIIKPFFELICKPLESMPNIYKAKRPILLYDLIQKLDKYEYKIIKLVMNFNNKIIGVLAQEPDGSEKTGFIPCYPSALDDNLKKDLDFVFMTDLSLWNNYYNTITFLNKLDKRSKKRKSEPEIPCKPAFKIVEDEHVVGILTNTDQFIQISQPIRLDEINAEIDLPSITDENYIVNSKKKPMVASDTQITTKLDADKEREDYIKKIRLETSFYNVFRNTIRILLNDYENIKWREKIESEMEKEYIIYNEKLDNMNKLLRGLVKDKVQFIGDNNYYKLIKEVTSCVVKDENTCNESPNLCAVTGDGKCNLILPQKNLITGKMNELIYFGRMSDELIRYNRIKSFILEPQIYLSFHNVGYNLRENEIILIQSIINQEYFETLVPATTNKYVKYNTFDETQPLITQVYENNIPSLNDAIGRKNEKICEKVKKNHIVSSIWKKCFPEKYTEIEYSKYSYCTFQFIIDLIEKKTGKKYDINEIKNQLYDEYKKYIEKYKNKMVDIIILEGKKTLGDQVKSDVMSFASLIYTDNYFLTTFDLWLLVVKYEIPCIFISQKWILQTKYEKHEFVGYGKKEDKFAFVVIPGLRTENIPNFKLIQSNDDETFIDLNKLNVECTENLYKAIDNKVDIETYLENFVHPTKIDSGKKQPNRLLIESDSEENVQVKPKKKKLIVEESSPVSPEEYIIQPNKKKTKKVVLKGENKNKNKTKKQKESKNKKLLIIESDTENGKK